MASCWIEVNLSALRANYEALQTLVGPQCRLICVVKANAYGLGALECGREFLEAGAAMLAVTRLDEALPLRAAGLTGDILLLTPSLSDEIESVVEQRLVACVADLADAQRLSSVATRRGVTARAHWKLDTGMGRLGTRAEEAAQVWAQMKALPNLSVEACFTHFAHAGDADIRPTQQAFGRFEKALQGLQILGAHHCANSPTLVRFPTMRLSCARPGTILYGQFPSVATRQAGEAAGLKLRDPFAAKARVITVREIKPGESVGYGSEWTATRPTKVATLAIGYADGLTLEPHARVESPVAQLTKAVKGILKPGRAGRNAALHGRECPILGRIAMQQCSIDITGVPDVKVGDVATVRMRRLLAGAHLSRLYVSD